jgi:hypothetical protein
VEDEIKSIQQFDLSYLLDEFKKSDGIDLKNDPSVVIPISTAQKADRQQ